MLLESFDANSSTAAVVDVLRRDGGVIVRDLDPVNLIDAYAAELRCEPAGGYHTSTYSAVSGCMDAYMNGWRRPSRDRQ